MRKLYHRIVRLLLLVIISGISNPSICQKVKIISENGSYTLLVDGKPFFIKGAVANEFYEKIPLHGGNAIRSGARDLDKMQSLGLKVLVNLQAGAERSGFNYSDTTAVKKQKERIIATVRGAKDHPAVLMWAIGNELDYIPGTLPYNLKLWDAINDIAVSIKAIDPNHPVMTVIGTSMIEKIAEITKRCPALDLLGINTYGDMYRIPEDLKKYDWKKPYVITEWGTDGYWETPKTDWKAPYEQTGREKAITYEKKYRTTVMNESKSCLGEFVFYWSGFKQETTHTWFCMFDKNGYESATVDVMHRLWLGKEPENHAPLLDSMWIMGFQNIRSIYLEAGKLFNAKSFASDADGNQLRYEWEIRPEANYASYAGQGEKVPQPIPDLIKLNDAEISFTAPSDEGPYRLFVYVYDGKEKFSTANLPFFVKTQLSK